MVVRQPGVVARNTASLRQGTRNIRESHAALLLPYQLVPGCRINTGDGIGEHGITRAWELTIALSAASNASSTHPGQLTPQETAALMGGGTHDPHLRAQYAIAAQHCAFANAALPGPTANLEVVRMPIGQLSPED